MYKLLKQLFPYCRSITGDGVRRTLREINEIIPLDIQEIPSGTKCFDWTVPDEWNISSAAITGPNGENIVDFAEHNLHVMSYSEPVTATLSLDELKPHLYSMPELPDAIPYRSSYYQRRWGFCIPHRLLQTLKPGDYRVEINSSLKPGSMTIAEAYVPGRSKKEIFFSSYVCHPSMANDSLSGVVLNVELCKHVIKRQHNRYSYRFLFVPETIGAIAYLSLNKNRVMNNTHCGMVLTCEGDNGPFHYKKTRQGNHELDHIVENLLQFSNLPHQIQDFWLPGSDERQYSSPGFNLPTGSLIRSMYGEFPQYHNSDDNLDFVTADALQQSFDMHKNIIECLEANHTYLNTQPFGEPFLSKYGLYKTTGGPPRKNEIQNVLTTLNFADGNHSLVDIARKNKLNLLELIQTANTLRQKDLLKIKPETPREM